MIYKKINDVNIELFDSIVVGCGFAGAVVAQKLSSANKKVLIIEKRPHIAGNMYDSLDDHGILIHNYGPHIFHTEKKRVFEYLTSFVEFNNYQHRVLADIHRQYMPVPFNKKSLKIAFGEDKSTKLLDKLISVFGDECKVTINQLKSVNDNDINQIADYVYNNIFLKYTMKQWGVTPDEVDTSVLARVPIFISDDDRYFQDEFQAMPSEGYTKLFEAMLDNENICCCLDTDFNEISNLVFVNDELKNIKILNNNFNGFIVYTGPLDEMFDYKFGHLPYRSLDFEFEHKNVEYFLPCGTVNFTVSEPYTRITEFKYLTGQNCPTTTIMKEYSKPYTDPSIQTPYYAVLSDKSKEMYNKYFNQTKNIKNLYILGRLAEFKYYNMDAIIDNALNLSNKILHG